jgi:hypothetical protein
MVRSVRDKLPGVPPVRGKRQFLHVLAAAEAGRETQAPETASLIHAQRIHPGPGVLA